MGKLPNIMDGIFLNKYLIHMNEFFWRINIAAQNSYLKYDQICLELFFLKLTHQHNFLFTNIYIYVFVSFISTKSSVDTPN